MKEYFVNAPLIIWANNRDEAGDIAREKLDKCGFEYGMMGHGTEIRRSRDVKIVGSSELGKTAK